MSDGGANLTSLHVAEVVVPIEGMQTADKSDDPRVVAEKMASNEMILARAITDGDVPPPGAPGWDMLRELAATIQMLLDGLSADYYRDQAARTILATWLHEG